MITYLARTIVFLSARQKLFVTKQHFTLNRVSDPICKPKNVTFIIKT